METIILSNDREPYDKFLKEYIKDPLTARVMIEKGFLQKTYNEVILFKDRTDCFRVERRQYTFGVSISLKRYICRRVLSKLIFHPGKFYSYQGSNVRHMNFNNIHEFTSIHDHLYKAWPWMQIVDNYGIPITFNTIYRNKLTSYEKMVKFLYKVDYPTCDLLHKAHISKEQWELIKSVTRNHRHLSEDIIGKLRSHDSIFNDSITMAKALCKKINLRWSQTRLKLEHDKMAKEITERLFTADKYPIAIHEKFSQLVQELKDYPNIEVIEDTKRLYLEGVKNKNCVAGYKGYIEQGSCIILHYNGHTIEVVQDQFCEEPKQYRISQMTSIGNSSANPTDRLFIQGLLNTINTTQPKKLQYANR